ncbi:RHS repeat domain-containing protein [Chitinophaga caeni]|nr:RHS repeat-associated core domain-containing protein [Chitinophaga caeni]
MTVAYYDVDLLSAVDYYPFGMQMPGRVFNGVGYRYGFNGQENDNEVKGDGNSLDFGARIYDPRLGRFLSTDPFERKFLEESPYGFAGNNPVSYVDYNGMFKISPFFAKRYPTLAKIIKYYLPLLKDNPAVRDAWIKSSGYKDIEAGGKAFDEMVTYGNGPWISPTRPESEAKTDRIPIINKVFSGDGGGEFDGNYFPENLFIGYGLIENLETAVKKGDEDAIAETMFIVTTTIMHESAHYGGVIMDDSEMMIIVMKLRQNLKPMLLVLDLAIDIQGLLMLNYSVETWISLKGYLESLREHQLLLGCLPFLIFITTIIV